MPFPESFALMLGLGHAVGQATQGAVTEIAKRVVGPLADQAGETLKVWVNKRWGHLLRTTEQADAMLKAAGIEAQPVPGRILFPILEHCTLEEEPELQKKWAALLANAARPGPDGEVLPAYAEVLRQLTPMQARMLDWMYLQRTEWAPDSVQWHDVHRQQIEEVFPEGKERYALLVTDLERLQVIERVRTLNNPFASMEARRGNLRSVVGELIDRWDDPVRFDRVALTALGLAFVRACSPPPVHTSDS